MPSYDKLKNKHARVLFIYEDKTFTETTAKVKKQDFLSEFYSKSLKVNDFVMPSSEERSER
ncbi:MAG: hypothetical protein U9O87_03705 [Verrucomicrobiota bacterium]|nr:hypothetical protein [Verrucomicrobiota bacterium]